MTSQVEDSKHVTPEMCAVLRCTAEHGSMAKIAEPWLGPVIVLWRCFAGRYAARLTPAGAEVLSTWLRADKTRHNAEAQGVRSW
jgi:hypothetical protein